ncbi:MAG: hypothetical protein ABH823_00175, partial [bacterium]
MKNITIIVETAGLVNVIPAQALPAGRDIRKETWLVTVVKKNRDYATKLMVFGKIHMYEYKT